MFTEAIIKGKIHAILLVNYLLLNMPCALADRILSNLTGSYTNWIH